MTSLATLDQKGNGIKSKDLGKKLKPELQKRSEIPTHLQFNRYVLNHYRPPTDWTGCLYSLFYVHNETVNIFTHAIPMVAILLAKHILLPWDEITVPFLPTLHMVAFISPWVGSTIYHLFMNHEHGHSLYKKLLLTDMLGIWIAQNLGSLTTIYTTFYCFEQSTQNLIMLAFACASLISLYKAIVAKCPWERRYSFIMPFVCRLCVYLIRLSGIGGGHPDAMKYLIFQDVIAISGAFIGVSNIPERWFPGNLDLFFNSHHIMHVLVVYAAYLMHLAVIRDLLWMSGINKGDIVCS